MLETMGSSVYSPQKNALFDHALLKGTFALSPDQTIRPQRRHQADHSHFERRACLSSCCPTWIFGIKDAAFCSFFSACLQRTLTATARLSALTGAKIIPVIATFLPNYKGWRVKFYPVWEDYPGDDIIAATAGMNTFIEDRVKEAPAEYFWAHKRFKTRPPSESNPYEQTDGEARR